MSQPISSFMKRQVWTVDMDDTIAEVAGKDFDRQVSVGDHAHRLFVTGSLDCHHQGANVVRTHRVGGVAQRGACVDRDDLGLANGRNAHGGSGNEWCDATLRH